MTVNEFNQPQEASREIEWKESRQKCNTISKPGDYPEKIPKECPFENCTVWGRGGGSERSALPQKHKQLVSLLIMGQNCIPVTNEEMEQDLLSHGDLMVADDRHIGLVYTARARAKRHGWSRQRLIQGRKTQGFCEFTRVKTRLKFSSEDGHRNPHTSTDGVKHGSCAQHHVKQNTRQ